MSDTRLSETEGIDMLNKSTSQVRFWTSCTCHRAVVTNIKNWLLCLLSFRSLLYLCFSLHLQVTYRVVQVTDQHLDGREDGGGAVSVVSTAAFTGAPQAVAQVPKSTPFFFIDQKGRTVNMDCFYRLTCML